MITAPVKRMGKQKITSYYGKRGNHFHHGIDLRCVRFPKEKGWLPHWSLQSFVVTENSQVLRVKRDAKDNGIIVLKPFITDYAEIKYMHINVEEAQNKFGIEIGVKLMAGDILGYSELRGQSAAHHLHFEVWRHAGRNGINPLEYFEACKIKYK